MMYFSTRTADMVVAFYGFDPENEGYLSGFNLEPNPDDHAAGMRDVVTGSDLDGAVDSLTQKADRRLAGNTLKRARPKTE
jgi:hypothetical protein